VRNVTGNSRDFLSNVDPDRRVRRQERRQWHRTAMPC